MTGLVGREGWLDSVAPHTRAIVMPHGPHYLITMPGWYWNSLDWMYSTGHWSEPTFLTFAWKTTLNARECGVWGDLDNLQEIFTNTLMRFIWIEITALKHRDKGAVNDCRQKFWPDPLGQLSEALPSAD